MELNEKEILNILSKISQLKLEVEEIDDKIDDLTDDIKDLSNIKESLDKKINEIEKNLENIILKQTTLKEKENFITKKYNLLDQFLNDEKEMPQKMHSIKIETDKTEINNFKNKIVAFYARAKLTGNIKKFKDFYYVNQKYLSELMTVREFKERYIFIINNTYKSGFFESLED